MTNSRSAIGVLGETLARGYLEREGLIWIESNWFCRAGELDLVMRDGDEIAFVEVKTRRGDGAGRAEESISKAKARRLLASGSWYLQQHPELGDPIWRIDLLAITLAEDSSVLRLNHIANAVVSD